MTETTAMAGDDRAGLPSNPGIMNRKMVMAAVALVSFAGLLLELAMTRLFSVVLFYHFAFFAISMALLGLGSGGVFAHIRRPFLQRFAMAPLGACLCALNSVFIFVALEVVLHTPVSLEVNAGNFGRLTFIYLVTAIPFFFTGLLFSVLFARSSAEIPVLYGADLAGGASACLAVVPLLNFVGAPNALLFASLAMALAAALWAGQRNMRMGALALAAVFAALMAANHAGRFIDIVYAKGVRRDAAKVEFAQWNAISRIEVNSDAGARYIVIDADATSAVMNVDPALWAQDQTAHPTPTLTGLPAESGFNWRKSLMSAAPSVANVLRPKGEFAIIGPGGGVDVLRAVANGVMRGKYADYVYHLYERPQVDMHVQDGRSYVRNAEAKYDVVQMTLVDTWASTAAGAFALSENNLYTVEAFREYFEHLKPDGMIAITRWEFRHPREALRVVAVATEALHRLGVANPARNFIVASQGTLDEDGIPVVVLAKKTSFTAEEESAVQAHFERYRQLTPLYLPSQPGSNAFSDLIARNDPYAFAREYAYNVSPVSDNAPFFFFTLKAGQILGEQGLQQGVDWKVNLGVLVLLLVLVISVVAVIAFLVLPLALRGGSRRHSPLPLLYFVAVGLGYILVEIAFIQRFVLFLGHPTYALTVVIFLLMLSSGAGSLCSRRWLLRTQLAWIPLVLVIAVLLGHVFFLPSRLAALIGLGFGLRLVVSGLVLIPLGFVMGMPFPTGLRDLANVPRFRIPGAGLDAEASDNAVEWAWAMNASASVLGSVLAMVVAIQFGLNVTLACGAAAYLFALLLMPTLHRNAD